MECPRCGLSNMPGSAVCFRCGADLGAYSEPEAIEPPRAKRSSLRAGIGRKAPPRPGSLRRRLPEGYTLLLPHIGRGSLSVIPGLGQLINRQWSRAAAFGLPVLLGIVALVLGYDKSWFNPVMWCVAGILLIGMVDAALGSMAPELRQRLNPLHYVSIVSCLVSFLWLLVFFGYTAFHHQFYLLRINFEWTHPVLSSGETLLVKRDAWDDADPRRGEIVATQPPGGTLAQIVALPGDHVSIDKGLLVVEGVELQADWYADLDPGAKQELNLPPGGYLVLQFGFYGGQQLKRPVVLDRLDLEHRLVGVYGPPAHRRPIGEIP